MKDFSKATVNLANVDNTSDSAKPISTATQHALDLKTPINNPTCTGTVGGLCKATVNLAKVVNTSALAKPISTATHNALSQKHQLLILHLQEQLDFPTQVLI